MDFNHLLYIRNDVQLVIFYALKTLEIFVVAKSALCKCILGSIDVRSRFPLSIKIQQRLNI